MFTHGFTKLFLQPTEKQAQNEFDWVWLLMRRISGTVWESDGGISFFSPFTVEKADRLNCSSVLYHSRLNEWLPFSALHRSSARLNGYILPTRFPSSTININPLWFLQSGQAKKWKFSWVLRRTVKTRWHTSGEIIWKTTAFRATGLPWA